MGFIEEVADILKKLTQNVDKKTLFDLRAKLQDANFRKEFLNKDGISSLVSILDALQGNMLTYALSSLETALPFNCGWEPINQQFIEKIVSLINSSIINVCKSALGILTIIASNPSYGFIAVHEAFINSKSNESDKSGYGALVSQIGGNYLDTQLCTLELVNAMFQAAPLENKEMFRLILIQAAFNRVLLEQYKKVESPAFKKQVYLYQVASLEDIQKDRKITFSKDDPEHEDLILRLWKAFYPDRPLEARVGDHWKTLGFQGRDPVSDLRGAGLLGLKNLVFIAEYHPESFRRIALEQASRNDHYYPVATAGINISCMLCEIFHIGTKDKGEINGIGPIFPALLDGENAFGEIYAISLQLLDRIWDEMQASYMDFPKVIAATKQRVNEGLTNVSSIAYFDRFCGSISQLQTEKEPEHVKQLRKSIEQLVTNRMKNQKASIMKKGINFKVSTNSETEKQLNCKLDAYWQNILLIDESANNTTEMLNIIERSNNLIVTDNINNLNNINDTANDLPITYSFCIQSKDNTHKFIFSTHNKDDYIIWIDGLRLLLGAKIEHADNVLDFQVMVKAELAVRLLNIEGLVLPKKPPAIPPLPRDYQTNDII
eukprot:TRINITY_DN7203_c0_g1_i1.p1 TRINITY_DN7203_c0_g1~~TRINITY_DN7203_c0_g1_i1.p1  ORF type:complete len:604 (-),score=240.59 TRINITY_DN7203_c0_g1_i1:37-1848(-)